MSNKYSKIIWPALSILIMAAIFWFSSQNGDDSSNQSLFFTKWLAMLMDFDTASFIVRKTAHFTIYMVLGICLYESLFAWNVPAKTSLQILTAALLGMLYACSDEFHQLFVSERSGSLRDVLIDTCGSLTGAFIASVVTKWYFTHNCAPQQPN